MDWSTIPELANHFVQATAAVYTSLPDMIPDSAVDTSKNVWTALAEPDAMPLGQKIFQGAKFSVATITLGLCVAGQNIPGGAACVIAQGEVIKDLDEAGEEFREKNEPKPPSP